ncbi:MAG: PEFG-CTERM sorting domain-containing protein [Nitrosarchaeum sp.]|nr:PEFG-CTERM sorting domain-containing protein [Nitrosarchaeum sp.]
MFKIIMLILIATLAPISAFAEPIIELNANPTEIGSLDLILVTGRITDVSIFKPITLTVVSPDGQIIYVLKPPLDNTGLFKKIINPPLPKFADGTYRIIASHEDTKITGQTEFTVITGDSQIISAPLQETIKIEPKSSAITLNVTSKTGDNKITVTGVTTSSITDITFTVTSPNGNLISIAQVTPDTNGKFLLEIISGGPVWKEDGFYTVTANQGLTSEHKQSVQIEINNGVVVPEFGTIALMILAVSILAIITISSKSRIGIISKY